MPQGFARLSKKERIAAASRGGSAPKKKPAGFAAMSPERRRELAQKGGKKSAEMRSGAKIGTHANEQTKAAEDGSRIVSNNSKIRNMD